MSVKMTRKRLPLTTYPAGAPNDLPFFLEKKAYQGATGRVYPLPCTDRLSNDPVTQEYDAVTLENEYIDVTLLPELGGKIHGAKAKKSGYEFIYQNKVIKPALIGLAGPWVSGGVEFNWPQHHRPTTFMPTEASLQENPDGSKTCWMGEAEPFHRMRGMVGITVRPGSSVVEATAVVYNRTDAPLPFMWWNNLAVRVHSQYKAMFPPDVEWAVDHDRRAVISFPVMKGVFHTARPFDYKDGIDATWFSNIKLPTSVMIARGQSQMDFLGGYDYAANAGTITVSDHYYSTGKKMWTWGDCDFGRAWCQNLTDNEDRYIELMTGVYTDNQPDFTYILPGEMKTFSQVWYPVHGIGEVKNATREAALSLRLESGNVTVGAVVTSPRSNCRLTLRAKGAILLDRTCDLDPDTFCLETLPVPGDIAETDLLAQLLDENGVCLVAYQPREKGLRTPPKARPIPPRPREVASVEELYLHGAHLEQYKHHTYDPEDYYREALRREPEDLRCNHAMGRLMMEKGDFVSARAYLTRAIARLKMRNDNPADPQPIYDMARLERLQGNLKAAKALFYDASWQMGFRSACFYEIACIDCIQENAAHAEEMLRQCLITNAHHFAARTLLGLLTKDASQMEYVLNLAPQDGYARFALWLLGKGDTPEFLLHRPEDVIDVALDLAHAGRKADAIAVLNACKRPSQMVLYHRAHLQGTQPEHMDITLCFPNRLEDIAVLQGDDWQSAYLLGCLYYDRMNYAAAIAAWEESARRNPSHAYTWRNLAQAYFDHASRPQDAKEALERALSLAPNNPRILYELVQLYKNLSLSVEERVALIESHGELASQRDDLYLDYIILLTQQNRLQDARKLLNAKRFNIYEGGEGKLTRHHGWLYTLLGRECHLRGELDSALAWYQAALVYPANYGEGRHYSAQEGNIYYYTGLLLQDMNREEDARAAFEKAAGQPNQVTEISYFAALSHRALGREDDCRAMLEEMLRAADTKLANADLYGYFGVGTPAPLPFELDVRRANQTEAYLLRALALRGLGDEAASQQAVAEITALDPYNMKLCFLRKLEVL